MLLKVTESQDLCFQMIADGRDETNNFESSIMYSHGN
jgi:hypothetical protein